MYQLYLDSTLFPVTPSKMTLKITNQNKTVSLMNEGEASVLKLPGLTEIEFELLLPQQKYPFAVYEDGFHDAAYYLDILEGLKTGKKPFLFRLLRARPDRVRLFDTEMTVSLEDYSMKESASDGMDITVSVNLKQYRAYGIKKLVLETDDGGNTKAAAETSRTAKTPQKTYTVKSGDNLWTICKRELGDGSKCWDIAKKNGIANPNLIYPGQVLVLS